MYRATRCFDNLQRSGWCYILFYTCTRASSARGDQHTGCYCTRSRVCPRNFAPRNLQVDDVGTDERENRHENLRHVMHRVFDAEVVLHEVKLGVPRVEETATGGDPERDLGRGGHRHERPAVQSRQAENSRSPDPELRQLIRGGVEVIGDHLRRDQEHLEGIKTKGDGHSLDVLRFGHALRRRRRRHSLGCDLCHFARFSLQRRFTHVSLSDSFSRVNHAP
jgi:hypothetical protein